MSGPSDVEAAFRKLEPLQRHALDELEPDRLKVFKALAVAGQVGVPALSANELSKALHLAGIDITAVGATNALRGARGLVSKRRVGKTTTYSLMTAGSRALAVAEQQLGDGLSVLAVHAGGVHSARRTVGAVLAELDGVVRVSDPYFGRRTLDILAETKATSVVQLLTMTAARAKQDAMEREVADFCKQYPHIEVRIAPASRQIGHDRFVAASNELILVGHGLNDVGARDSYIVRIASSAAPGLLTDSIARFDCDWAGARQVR